MMTEKDTRELVRRIRAGIPHVAFRTNFIVGFPGETEEHFQTLLRYIEEEPFGEAVAPHHRGGDRSTLLGERDHPPLALDVAVVLEPIEHLLDRRGRQVAFVGLL